MVAKRFFYVSVGILCLALACHFGADAARAQGGSGLVALIQGQLNSRFVLFAMTSDGTVYESDFNGASWSRVGNVFTGPTPATQASWGQLKARYLGQPGASSPGVGR